MYALLTIMGLLLAQGGALPKGDLSGADAGKVKAPVKPAEKDEKRRNCLLDLMEPPGGNAIFTKDGSTLYFLANGGPAFKMAKKGGESIKSKYTLYKVDMARKKAEPMMSLDQKGDAALVLYGDPLEGMSVVSFIGKGTSCFEGAGGVLSISLVKKGAKAVQGAGAFVMARSPIGFSLVDVKKMQVLEMDTQTFQTKLARRVRAAERPLYFEPGDRRMVVFHDDGKNRGLVDYAAADDQKARRLAMKAGDKVLQSGKWFAAARLDQKANVIEIAELPEWTGPEKPGTYRIALPPAYPVATAGVEVNFTKRQALVFGASFLAKQQWQRLFVFDYTREDPVAVLPVSGKMYVNLALIDPTGAFALIEVRDIESRATAGLKLYNFATRKFEDLKLPPPKEGKEGKDG